MKRCLDVLIAFTALVILLPLMLLIAIAIRLDSAGPIFYSQERVGLNRRRRLAPGSNGRRDPTEARFGRRFMIFKFRSMVFDAERGTGAVWATHGDPRVTRLGRILRRTHLDELPQFFNVLRGDMSIVGPRPERPEIVERLVIMVPGYEQRFDVLPGITGLAQVEYTYDHSLQTAMRKLEFDLYYIRTCGVLFDMKLMAATMRVMVRANGGGAKVPHLANGHANGIVNGHLNGHLNGHTASHANGLLNGHVNGHTNGRVNGHPNGTPVQAPVVVPANGIEHPAAERIHRSQV
jgi:lipopolysaccharide/colanic/teichoic acid biosynthesis glycosyltransferase